MSCPLEVFGILIYLMVIIDKYGLLLSALDLFTFKFKCIPKLAYVLRIFIRSILSGSKI